MFSPRPLVGAVPVASPGTPFCLYYFVGSCRTQISLTLFLAAILETLHICLSSTEQIDHVICCVPTRRHVESREDPGNEVGKLWLMFCIIIASNSEKLFSPFILCTNMASVMSGENHLLFMLAYFLLQAMSRKDSNSVGLLSTQRSIRADYRIKACSNALYTHYKTLHFV